MTLAVKPITSYESFKEMMDNAISSPYGALPDLFITDKIKADIEARKYVRHFAISIASCITAITVQRMYSFMTMLRGTSQEQYRSEHGFVHDFGSKRKLLVMYDEMENLLNRWSINIDNICESTGSSSYSTHFADSLDYAEETLEPILEALKRLFYIKTGEPTASIPVDRAMLTELSMVLFLCDLSRQVFNTITTEKNFPNLKNLPEYNFLALDDIWNHIMKIQNKLDFRDTNGNELEFSIFEMITSPQSQAITDDIMYLMFSSEFLDELTKFQDGHDLELRNSRYKSLIDSFESHTISVRGFRNKYRKMYKQQNKKS